MADTFTKEEIEMLVPSARIAVDVDESPWVQLGEYFREQKRKAAAQIEARPTRKTD